MRQLIGATVATAFVLMASAAGNAQARPEAALEPPMVSTTGEAVIDVAPDRAWITITAESRAGNPREAQRRNVEAMRPVLAKLHAAGIAPDAIRTVVYDLQQEWDFVNDRRVSRGYVARNSVEVRVEDVERVGELLELAVGSGATSVGGVRFDLKDRAKLEREALRLAVVDARARAEAAAAGAGMAIDRIQRVDVQPTGGMPPMPRLALMREAAADSAPPISAGQMEIRAQVTLLAVLK